MSSSGEQVALLLHDVDFFLDGARVMGMNLRAVAVFQRGDNASAVGVVLGVGGGDDEDVQGQTDAVALDLHVALFHQVEQAHLDAFGQVGQFVDTEDAPVGARHQAVVDGGLVGQVAALGDLDGVDFANQVGDGNVGRRQLFGVAQIPLDPGDGGGVAHFVNDATGIGADGVIGVVVKFAAVDDGDVFVQQVDHGANQAGLGLAAFAQQDDVLAGQDGVFQLRDNGLLEADDAGEHRLFGADFGNQVAADFLAHGHGLIAAVAQFAEGGRQGVGGHAGTSFDSGRHRARLCGCRQYSKRGEWRRFCRKPVHFCSFPFI